MKLAFTAQGWADHVWWQEQAQHRATLAKINRMIAEALRDPGFGTGKPERLLGDFAGHWSRRITQEHRFVYTVDTDLDLLFVVQLRRHY